MHLNATSASFLPLLSLLVLSTLAKANYVVHELRTHIPPGWSLGRRHDPSEILPLRFGLKQSNMDGLEHMILETSHPDSPNYGNHWTPAQVAQTFAPANETIYTVRTWLTDSGFSVTKIRLSATKSWISVNATVKEAEQLLKTEYYVYLHEGGAEHVACTAYHLPDHVSPHVELVIPSIHFDAILPKRGNGGGPARSVGQPRVGIFPKTTGEISDLFTELQHCDKMITPVCLRALYGLVYEPIAADRNSLAIVEFTPQSYVQSDLDLFNKNFSSALMGKSPKLVSIDGGVVQQHLKGFDYTGESNLDLQYAMNLVNMWGYKQEITLYQVGDMYQGASLNNLLDALDGTYCQFLEGDDPSQDGVYPNIINGGYNRQDCGTVKPANIISASYGYNEADLSPFYTARQCTEYAKLGLMGVTVVYSSGDNGVAGNLNYCLNTDGSQSLDGKIFNPGFPATCPYVTTVGATQVNPGSSIFQPEGACEQVIHSGGGFSNYFSIPDYQKKAVANYLKNYQPSYSSNISNSTGNSRAFPDLSANGANYAVADSGKFVHVYGTSAAAPVIASILTMINDARLALGKKPIGFINPTIYSDGFADAFNDITSGGNQGCGTPGFTAVPGWDPVTGLGTPSFPKLLLKWLLLP